MEFPVTFLQDCARADKWLPFVCHAQLCQFPKEQVMYAVLYLTVEWLKTLNEKDGLVFTPKAVASYAAG